MKSAASSSTCAFSIELKKGRRSSARMVTGGTPAESKDKVTCCFHKHFMQTGRDGADALLDSGRLTKFASNYFECHVIIGTCPIFPESASLRR